MLKVASLRVVANLRLHNSSVGIVRMPDKSVSNSVSVASKSPTSLDTVHSYFELLCCKATIVGL